MGPTCATDVWGFDRASSPSSDHGTNRNAEYVAPELPSPRTSPPKRSRMLLRPTSHPHLVYPIATNAFIRDLGPLRARLIADRVHPAARTSAAPPTIMNVPLDRTSPRGPLRGIVFRCAWQHVLLCQEDAKASCCTRDEGRSFGAAL